MTTITRYPPTATTPQARNRVTNPAMLTGSVVGWAASTGAAPVEYSTSAGTQALRFATSASGVAVAETFVAVTPGELLSFRAEVRPFTTARTGLLRIYFTDAAFVNIAGPFSGTASALVGVFTEVQVNGVTAPAGAAYARILVGISDSAGAGQQIYVTRAMASNGSPIGQYFDGDTPSLYPLFYYWEGQRGLSASRRVDVLGGPDQIHPTAITVPFRVTREGRSYARPLLESSSARAVLVPAGPRQGEFVLSPGGRQTNMDYLDFFAAASLFYIVDESWATMWFAIAGDIEFNQEWGNIAQLTVPFVETPAP